MIKKLEMSYEMHVKIIKYVKSNINFVVTFLIDSFNLLNKFKLDLLKSLREKLQIYRYFDIYKFSNNIILSTGMAKLNEISDAIKILKNKSDDNFTTLYTEYPTPFDDINLKAMLSLKNILN